MSIGTLPIYNGTNEMSFASGVIILETATLFKMIVRAPPVMETLSALDEKLH